MMIAKPPYMIMKRQNNIVYTLTATVETCFTNAVLCMVIEFAEEVRKTAEGDKFRQDGSTPFPKLSRRVFDTQKHPTPGLSDQP